MSRRTKSPKRSLIVNVAIIGVTFYIGFMAGTVTSPLGPGAEPSYITIEGSKATSLLQKQVNSLETDLSRCKHSLSSSASSSSASSPTSSSKQDSNTPPFSQHDWNWSGYAAIDSNSFMSEYDFGIPSVASSPKQGLLLFHSKNNNFHDGKFLDLEPGLESCNEVDVITTNIASNDHCLVVLEHYQGYHVQRFVRARKEGENENGAVWSKIDSAAELQHVGRGWSNGGDAFKSPSLNQSKEYWKKLELFFGNHDILTARLKPKLEKIQKDNTIVVMVANLGVLELLTNFVCSSRARGLDISNVIVFATDAETREAMASLGVETFDDEGAFGDVPKAEAKHYGDQTFAKMMYVKVVAVYLPMMLGYNVLFQDVDVVWNESPHEFFNNDAISGEFDAYFEDDGARSKRYAPYSPNSGFYYLQHNARTLYFMTQLLYSGDMIIVNHSHQQTMTSVLTEFSSLVGLNVKILDGKVFAGGKQFHHDKAFMRDWMENKVAAPKIFHMCWTANKDDKLLYLQQLGEWYLPDSCGNNELSSMRGDAGKMADCCLAEPAISCHFIDKPSIVKCDESPNRDQNGKKFWN